MVEVKEIILYDERRFCLPINGAQFARILAGTPRWNTVTTLCLECSTPIALAALNHCDPDVLKSVSLNAWSQSINDTGDEWGTSNREGFPWSQAFMDPAYSNIVNAWGPLTNPSINATGTSLCQALNSSNVEHFAIGLNLDCFDDEFLALFIAIGVQGQSEAECEHLFDENDYVDDSLGFDKDDLIQWNVNLTNRIISACPNLRTVRVYYESSGQCYCPACRRGLGAYIYGYRLDNGGTFTELREGE
ncbi:hypothetical protein ACHAP4_007649 [Fusarium culmorum]